jgi:hypothetical protein
MKDWQEPLRYFLPGNKLFPTSLAVLFRKVDRHNHSTHIATAQFCQFIGVGFLKDSLHDGAVSLLNAIGNDNFSKTDCYIYHFTSLFSTIALMDMLVAAPVETQPWALAREYISKWLCYHDIPSQLRQLITLSPTVSAMMLQLTRQDPWQAAVTERLLAFIEGGFNADSYDSSVHALCQDMHLPVGRICFSTLDGIIEFIKQLSTANADNLPGVIDLIQVWLAEQHILTRLQRED